MNDLSTVRYVASLDSGRCKVSLACTPDGCPFGTRALFKVVLTGLVVVLIYIPVFTVPT